MDKRIKFTFKQQESAVRSVVVAGQSVMSVAQRLGCAKKTLQRWVKLYEEHGNKGLRHRNGSYTGDFKLKVIRHMLKNKLSISEVAAIFGVPNDSTVGKWFILYETEGATGLLEIKRRGRKKSMKPKDVKKSNNKNASCSDQLAALQAENEYLRAENAFLKKLKALIEEEEAAKTRSKQPKPSKD